MEKKREKTVATCKWVLPLPSTYSKILNYKNQSLVWWATKWKFFFQLLTSLYCEDNFSLRYSILKYSFWNSINFEAFIHIVTIILICASCHLQLFLCPFAIRTPHFHLKNNEFEKIFVLITFKKLKNFYLIWSMIITTNTKS